MIALLAGCVTQGVFEAPDPGWQRMWLQSRKQPYDASPVFPDGAVMRVPPEGTVAREDRPAEPPGRPTLEALHRGQAVFATHCAPCHGADGSGDSPVARAMTLVRPPDLTDTQRSALTVDDIARVAREGYGLMPAYGGRLRPDDVGAVAWYVEALQRSRGVPLDSLPEPMRARARAELP